MKIMKRSIFYLIVSVVAFVLGVAAVFYVRRVETDVVRVEDVPPLDVPIITSAPALTLAPPVYDPHRPFVCSLWRGSNIVSSEKFDIHPPRPGCCVKAISKPVPSYPEAARHERVEGLVPVRIVVDEGGSPETAEAVSGHLLLREAAVRAACQARFTPTTLSGRPVKVSGIITYNFVLQGRR